MRSGWSKIRAWAVAMNIGWIGSITCRNSVGNCLKLYSGRYFKYKWKFHTLWTGVMAREIIGVGSFRFLTDSGDELCMLRRGFSGVKNYFNARPDECL